MNIDLSNESHHKKMVKWFCFRVLMSAAKRAIISGIFGAYADRRLTHAALDSEHNCSSIDLTNDSCITDKNDIWIDYVSDLGDGFDSTYAIAYLLGQENLHINKKTLPRGNILIMGGDEVYPVATREEYYNRFERPYSYAFPNNSENNENTKPYAFLLPGNHDWYDGLTLFLAKFCHGVGGHLGARDCISNWRLKQTRSYFAIKLPNNWWIWGLDTQLGEDIDSPQDEYFRCIAEKHTTETAQNFIICSATPSWLKANSQNGEEKEHFKRTIDHVAQGIIKKYWKTSRIHAVLSGDLHHYSRYEAKKSDIETHFITAGGGGAFLHPTHQLKNEINEIIWLNHEINLIMPTANSEDEPSTQTEACYPAKKISKRLALNNWIFPFKNIQFSLILGLFYSATAFLLMMLRTNNNPENLYNENYLTWFTNNFCSTICSPITFVLFLVLFYILYMYALYEDKEAKYFEKITHGFLHSVFHFMAIVLLTSIFPIFFTYLSNMTNPNDIVVDWYPRGWPMFFMLVAMIPFGFVGGFIWGLYLLITSRFYCRHSNDAFSAMQIEGYKNFLRINITKKHLTIYPIGLNTVPNRDEWEINTRTSAPKVIPKNEVQAHLIEKPIRINIDK